MIALSNIPEQIEHIDKLNQLAHEVASQAHRNQKRKGTGKPYIVHPEAVAAQLPVNLKALGFLHDVIEDTAFTLSQMTELFPPWVVERVIMLTRIPNENYDDYIMRVREDDSTRLVKIADLRHNLHDILSGSLRDKYRLALRLLREDPDAPFTL